MIRGPSFPVISVIQTHCLTRIYGPIVNNNKINTKVKLTKISVNKLIGQRILG